MAKKWFYCSFVVCLMLAGPLFSADTLYVTTGDGHLLGIAGMTSGTHARGSGGDNTFADIDWTGGVNGGAVGLNVVAAGPGIFDPNNPGQSNGTLVVAGSADAALVVYDGTLATNKDVRIISSNDNPVTALAIGDFGTLAGAVIAAHPHSSGSNMLVYKQDPAATGGPDPFLKFQPNPITLGPLGAVISDLVIGDTDPTRPGNEAMSSSNNVNTLEPTSGTITRVLWDDGGFPLIELPQQNVNNFISALALGDLFPGKNADEIIQFGANETGANPTFNGDSAQAFTSPGSGVWDFKWFNTGDGDPNNGTGTDGTIADVNNDPGLEAITVGDSKIIIVNADAAGTGARTLDIIDTGRTLTSVVVADVLGDDGVGEIVVGSSSGALLAYQHLIPSDLGSPFALAATLLLDPQDDGTEYQITDIATTGATALPCIPPVGDLNGDCVVNEVDFAIFASNWLVDTNI